MSLQILALKYLWYNPSLPTLLHPSLEIKCRDAISTPCTTIHKVCFNVTLLGISATHLLVEEIDLQGRFKA